MAFRARKSFQGFPEAGPAGPLHPPGGDRRGRVVNENVGSEKLFLY